MPPALLPAHPSASCPQGILEQEWPPTAPGSAKPKFFIQDQLFFFLLTLKNNNGSHCQAHSPFYYSLCLPLDFLLGCVIRPLQYPFHANTNEALGGGEEGLWPLKLGIGGPLRSFVIAPVPQSCSLNSVPSFQDLQPLSGLMAPAAACPLLSQDSSLLPHADSPHSSLVSFQCRSRHPALLSCLKPSVAPRCPKDKI